MKDILIFVSMVFISLFAMALTLILSIFNNLTVLEYFGFIIVFVCGAFLFVGHTIEEVRHNE